MCAHPVTPDVGALARDAITRGSGRCDVITVRGDRCTHPATVEAFWPSRGWERYCAGHARYYGLREHRTSRPLRTLSPSRSSRGTSRGPS